MQGEGRSEGKSILRFEIKTIRTQHRVQDIYEDAISSGHGAYLLEEDGK